MQWIDAHIKLQKFNLHVHNLLPHLLVHQTEVFKVCQSENLAFGIKKEDLAIFLSETEIIYKQFGDAMLTILKKVIL